MPKFGLKLLKHVSLTDKLPETLVSKLTVSALFALIIIQTVLTIGFVVQTHKQFISGGYSFQTVL